MDRHGHVLIAEDYDPLRRVIAGELKRAGFLVESVSSSDEALALAARENFDVVVSDLQMPGRTSGMDLLREMKRTQPETEVVIATGHASMDIALDCMRCGAFDLILKPISTGELVSTVRRAVVHHRLRNACSILEIGTALAREDNRGRLPERLVELTCSAMEADDASIMFPGPNGRLYVAHSNGFSIADPTDRAVLRGVVAAGVAATRVPRIIGWDIDPDAVARLTGRREILSSIVFPLVTGDRVLGVLCFNRTRNVRPFGKEHLERARVLAGQAVLAIEHVELTRRLVASEKLAAIGQIAASISHEINNPLACISANLSWLAVEMASVTGSDTRPGLADALADAKEGVLRIRNIVSDMRSVSRSGSDVRLDLNEPIAAAIRLTMKQLLEPGVPMFHSGTGCFVHGAAPQLVQVFINLLVNAAHAMKGRSGGVRIETSLSGSNVEARVIDRGCGVSPENRDRIFEPFFTTKPASEGSGLGLGICREIVRRHGGEITLEETGTGGSTFLVRLPLSRDATA